MILYHGSDMIVNHPDILHSKEHLDFGIGFYTTTMQTQAERWAKRKAAIKGIDRGIVNIYDTGEFSSFNMKDFGNDLKSWIDFVCECRNGSDCFRQYDIIKGRVADDNVYRVVDMYNRGLWSKTKAIKEIKAYEKYDQIAFISQKTIDMLLMFNNYYEVKI